VIVTLDPNQVVLPPTFTPSPTPEPTATLTPSPTPLPLSTYPILFAAIPTGGSIPALFRGLADGTQIENVGDDRGYYDLALSPGGEQIAFIRSVAPADGGDANLQLFTAPVNDPTRVRQLTGVLNAGMEHPVWARDGQSIVVAANLDGDLDLFRVAADPDGEAELQALTVNNAFDSYPAYSPDGARLVYVSDVNTPGFPRLFTFDAAGAAQPFSNVSGSLSDPAFSPDGSQIAYVNRQTGDPDIWVINADGQRPFQLTVNDSATDRAIAWSDDGAWLAFASDRINSRFLWFFLNPDSGQIVPLSDLSEAQSLAFLPR
jgi:Tol biopolymer transport system component